MASVSWGFEPAYTRVRRNRSGILGLLLRFAVPLYITYAYQLIPVPIRKVWGMRGDGSSHILIEAAIRGERNLWPTFLRCCSGIRYLPGYMAGASLRPFLNLSRKA